MKKSLMLILSAAVAMTTTQAMAQGTAFAYQGRLQNNGAPATGSYDFIFTLYATNVDGVAVAGPLTNSATAVSNGLFNVTIDFGSGVFNGSNYWLDVSVSPAGSNTFTDLTPRQPILPTPYAILANTANYLLGGLPASQVTGTIPMAKLPSTIVTNTETGVTLSGTFSGSGSGLTGLNPANLSSGTAAINISGNAATATSAYTAGIATNAAIANNFSGSLSGDVTGTQGATVVSTVGGVSAANVASGANAANSASSADTAHAIVQRDASGNFSAGTITATLAGNATSATTAANFTGNIADSQLSANVPRLSGANAFGGTNSFAGVTIATNPNNVIAGTFSGNGASLTGLNPANLSAGTAAINISGNAATATTAASATTAGTATSAATAATAGTAATAALASNVVSGINITNAFITNSVFAGNGGGLNNLNALQLVGSVPAALLTSVPAGNLTGTVPLAQLPAAVVTNMQTGVTLNGTFSGTFTGLTNAPSPTADNYTCSYTTNTVTVGTTFQAITNTFDAQISGWLHKAGQPNYTNAQTGLYLVQYDAEVAETGNNPTLFFHAVDNGTEITASQSAITLENNNVPQPVSKSFIASFNSGDVLQFQFVSTTGSNKGEIVGGAGAGVVMPSFSCTITRIK